MKLVEECVGNGELLREGQTIQPIGYRVRRYQGMAEGSGMPIPGLFRIEGSIHITSGGTIPDWIGASLGLRLEDGRVLGITIVDIVDTEGQILSEGHGPSKCRCC